MFSPFTCIGGEQTSLLIYFIDLSIIFVYFRFKACLYKANTQTADIVGSWFFDDLFGAACFNLKVISECIAWSGSWWSGWTCNQYENQKEADISFAGTY